MKKRINARALLLALAIADCIMIAFFGAMTILFGLGGSYVAMGIFAALAVIAIYTTPFAFYYYAKEKLREK